MQLRVLLLCATTLCATTRIAAGEEHPATGPEREWSVLPALGYNPDTGLDIGVFTHVVQLDPEVHPYRWRVRGQVQTSILFEDGIELPRYEHYLRLDLPGLPDEESRLRLDVTWKRQLNVGYFGVGNDSRAGDPAVDGDGYHEFRAESLRGKVILERQLGRPAWRGLTGVELEHVDVDTYGGSLLAHDVALARNAGEEVAGTGLFTLLVFQLGLVLDTRDHETFPTRGLFHDLVVRAAPSSGDGTAWGGLTYTTRFYVPIFEDDVVVATRALGDVLVGDAPLMELARYGGLLPAEALGGSDGVRGITGGRFIGKTKILGNAELRALLLPFRLFREDMNLGAAAFFDTGRVWTDTLAPDRDLDGSGLGLHWGAGAGARLRWGDALLVRLDAAHSPNTKDFGGGPVAIYLTADGGF